MKFSYKNRVGFSNYYVANCPNIAFYIYWDDSVTVGTYKKQLFGLYFKRLSREVANHPSGIKINR